VPYLYIENFETGLDTRKTRFTAPAGSLRVLQNAHINRGKEIERRKAFVSVASLPAGTLGLHAVQDQNYVFGSTTTPAGLPALIQYQQLVSPHGGTLNRIFAADNFAGKIYAVAGFTGGAIHHFYDGTVIDDWETLSAAIGSTVTIANALSLLLDEDGAVSVIIVGNKIVLTGVTAGTGFGLTVSAGMTATELQAAVAEVAEVKATASFIITGGTEGTTFNTIAAVTIDNAELIGGPIDYTSTVDATAAAVANAINIGLTSYTATSTGGQVDISATAGLGASANGRVLGVIPTGDVTVGSLVDMAGGANVVPAIPEISSIVVDSYTAATLYTVTLDSVDHEIRGDSSAMPQAVRTIQQKVYAVVGSLLYFSGLAGAPAQADPTKWINDATGPPVVVGAGFIDLSTQDGGSEILTGIGVYEGKVAVFSRRSIQIWTVDPDPNLNVLNQVLQNVGAIASESILEYGDVDVFFLATSGLRSLRARNITSLASASDVGVSIDAQLTDYMNTLSRQQVRQAKAVVEPIDSRYMIAIGNTIYVFSNFTGSQVSAWSTYVMDGAVSGDVSSWSIADGVLHARVGDEVLRYGGFSGDEYDNSLTEVILPFLDANNPAMMKVLQGIDAGVEGTWAVSLATEPNDPDVWEEIADFTESTYGSVQQVGAVGRSTHFSLKITTTAAQACVIGNLLLHYDETKAN